MEPDCVNYIRFKTEKSKPKAEKNYSKQISIFELRRKKCTPIKLLEFPASFINESFWDSSSYLSLENLDTEAHF